MHFENPPQALMVPSSLGTLKIIIKGDVVTGLHFTDSKEGKMQNSRAEIDSQEISRQINEYLQGKRRQFNMKTDAHGTSFQKKVWRVITEIPFGQTVTYGAIAKELGDIKKVRAVGRAVGANPIPILIPCHRVVGSDGSLTGFSGGIWRKKWLLKHEHITLF